MQIALEASLWGVRQARKLAPDEDNSFPQQFVLSAEDLVGMKGWANQKLTSWHLYVAPNVKVATLRDTSGLQFGWLIGQMVDASGNYVPNTVTFDFDASGADWIDTLESWIEKGAGRFACIIDTARVQRIYGDPVGDYSMVFNKTEKLVASSPNLAIRAETEFHPDFDKQKVLEGMQLFSLQQTPYQDVLRALPNHYLDLDAFTCVRHWPKPDTKLSPPADWEHSLDWISARLAQVVGALARNQKVALPMSGGRDSRNLAGAARGELSQLAFGFAIRFHKMSRIDMFIGNAIARREGIPFRRIANRDATEHEIEMYRLRTGFTHGSAPLRTLGGRLDLPGGHLVLRGNVMELLRANQWNGLAAEKGILKQKFGIKRLLMYRGQSLDPVVERWGDTYEAWRQTLPANALSRQLDFGFVEHLLPNSLGVQFLGEIDNFYMNPFSDRRIIQLAMQIDPAVRRQDTPNRYLLEKNCPQWADIPFERAVATGEASIPKH